MRRFGPKKGKKEPKKNFNDKTEALVKGMVEGCLKLDEEELLFYMRSQLMERDIFFTEKVM